MNKRAPGHWFCYGLPGKHDWGVGNRSIEICDGLSEPDARFIASAPDMEDALVEIAQSHHLDICGHSKPFPTATGPPACMCHVGVAKAALAKARGGVV